MKMEMDKLFLVTIIILIGFSNLLSKEYNYYYFKPYGNSFYRVFSKYGLENGLNIRDIKDKNIKAIKYYRINLKNNKNKIESDSILLSHHEFDKHFNPVYFEYNYWHSGYLRVNFNNYYQNDFLHKVEMVLNDSNDYENVDRISGLNQNKRTLGKLEIEYDADRIKSIKGIKENGLRQFSFSELVEVNEIDSNKIQVLIKKWDNYYSAINFTADGKIDSELYGESDESLKENILRQLDTMRLYYRKGCNECYLAKTVFADRLLYIGDFCNDDEIKIVINEYDYYQFYELKDLCKDNSFIIERFLNSLDYYTVNYNEKGLPVEITHKKQSQDFTEGLIKKYHYNLFVYEYYDD